MVREGPTSRLYIDGALDSSSTAEGTTNISNDADLLVGNGPCVGVDGTEFFDGELDEIEYFSVALSAAQVQAIYDAGSAGKCKPGTGPVITSVVNGASSFGGGLSPGVRAEVHGQNLSAAPGEFCFSGEDPWPTIIPPCNAMVLINGEPAPMTIVTPSGTRIDFQIPFDEPAGKGTPSSSVEIVVDVAGARSEPVMVELQRFAPAILTGFDGMTETGQFFRVNDPPTPAETILLENRAVPGDTIRALTTGLGPTDPPVPTGFQGRGEALVAQPKILIHGAAKAVRRPRCFLL